MPPSDRMPGADLPSTKPVMDALMAIGLNVDGITGTGVVSWAGTPNEPLAALVWAARNKALSSTEGQTLKAALTTAKWNAYVAARQAIVEDQRRDQYILKVLFLIVKLFYTAQYTNGVPTFNTQLLLQAKNAIDAIIAQYPDEVG